MDLKIEVVSAKPNPLLGRRDVRFVVQQPITPSRKQVREELASTLKVDLTKVYVVSLGVQTGSQKTQGEAHVYDSEAQAMLVEMTHIVERNKGTKKVEDKEES